MFSCDLVVSALALSKTPKYWKNWQIQCPGWVAHLYSQDCRLTVALCCLLDHIKQLLSYLGAAL